MVGERRELAGADGSEPWRKPKLPTVQTAWCSVDSTESPVHGQQEGSAYNGHFESLCYHPLLLFNQHGDCLGAKLRPGNVHSAEDWDELLQRSNTGGGQTGDVPRRRRLRQARAVDYVSQNKSPARTSCRRPNAKPLVRYKSFRYQVEGKASCRQGRASPGRTIPARRICRDEHELAEPLGRAVLQSSAAPEQEDRNALDPLVVFPSQRGTAATQRWPTTWATCCRSESKAGR